MVVAREILRMTRAGQPAYISIVVKNLKAQGIDVDKSNVSARFNDLANKYPDGFMIDGRRWIMEPLKNKVFDPTSGKSGQFVNAYAMRLHASTEQQATQTSLF